ASLTYWQAEYTPTVEGFYRIYSRASDDLGNAETNPEDWYDGAFIVDNTAPLVTWLSPANGSGHASGYINLQAEVSDFAQGTFNIAEIRFEIDGSDYPAEWLPDDWLQASQTPRIFYLHTDGLVTGTHTVKAVAIDNAGNQSESALISFNVSSQSSPDTTPPSVAITSHTDGEVINNTTVITITGTGSDAESGILGYEISLNGGTTWEALPDISGSFSYRWELGEQQGTSYPVQVRASDWAGNSAVAAIVLSIDNVPPDDISPITYDVEPGYHLDYWADLTLGWKDPTDSSGTTQIFILASDTPGQNPTNPVYENPTGVALAEWTTHYVSLGVADVGGNQINYYFGPWYTGAVRDDYMVWHLRNQSIYRDAEGGLDGTVDVEHWEWLSATEHLDDDPRSVQHGEQSLYATWDGGLVYVGWEGAWWDTDGTLWTYYDVSSGGTTTPIGTNGSLPFEADYALSIDDTENGTLWTYSGGGWLSQAIPEDPWVLEAGFAHNTDLGETELMLGFGGDTSALSQHRMLAFATDDSGEIWSSFPIANGLDGNFDYYYDWNISTGTDLLELPLGAQLPYVLLDLDSPQPPLEALGVNSEITYYISLDNQETETVTNTQLLLTVSSGLTFQSVDGAACIDCASGDNWLLDTPDLLTDTQQIITVTAQLAANLSGIEQVTTTVALQTSYPLRIERLSHYVDGDPPMVLLNTAPGNAVPVGLQTLTGTSDDGTGIGVEKVEVRSAGGSWQMADGTRHWSFTTSPTSSPSWEVEVRATDYYGHSSTVTETLMLDDAPPTTTVTIPPLVGGLTGISGTAIDPYPADAQVESVQAQVDSANAPWDTVTLYNAAPDSSRNWLFMSNLPSGDGAENAFRFQVTDYAGNVSFTDWYTTVVDTVSPSLTANQLETEVLKLSSTLVLSGTVSDGNGLDNLVVLITLEGGNTVTETLTPVGDSWQYLMMVSELGNYTLEVNATDLAGNVQSAGPFSVLVDSAPVADDEGYNLDEDTVLTVVAPGVLEGDSDEDGDSLTASVYTGPTNGSLALASDGGFTYVPDAHFFGTDTFTYTVTDGKYTDTGLVTITVNPLEDDVYAQDDDYFVLVNQTRTVPAAGVLGNDLEVDGDVITAVLSSPPPIGALDFNPDGSFVYTPTLGYTGTLSFGYFADDGKHEMVDMHSVLLVHLPFDDQNNPTADVTGNGYDGVLSGTVDFTQTVPLTISTGNALWFTGQAGEAVEVGGLVLTDTSVTIAFWAQRIGTEEQNYIFSQMGEIGWADHLYMSIIDFDGNPNAFLECGIGTDSFPSRTIVEDTLWHHYVCVFDYDAGLGTTTISLYQDGVQLGNSHTVPDVYVGSGVATLGRFEAFDGPHTYNGGLDDFRIYKRALSDAEIAQLAAHDLNNGANFATVTLSIDTILPDLDVSVTGTGSGSVSSDPAGIDCGSDCNETFSLGTPVTLTAVPELGSAFGGWIGDCSGAGECLLLMDATRKVTATFTLNQNELAVTLAGTGSGMVSSIPAGIMCETLGGSNCTKVFDYNTVVTLTAIAAADSGFVGWGGACSGTGDCIVTMDAAKDVSAIFTLNQYNLVVHLAGNGTGSVSSTPTGIDCGSDCNETYDHGTLVQLTPVSGPTSSFAGWSGACSGTGICELTIESAQNVTATFTLQSYSLDVSLSGTGSGTVSSFPAGIDCGTACTATFDYGTVVTLTAAADLGSTFIGWAGACSGAGDCVVTIDAAQSVSAVFTLGQYPLSVTLTGNGSGAVSSTPAGIDCDSSGGSDCSELYEYGTVVTLTAVADLNSVFAGWTGACVGSANCVVTIGIAQAVTATFALEQHPLSVALGGNGSGTVSSNPPGIDCGSGGTDCMENFDYGTVITLTATTDTGSTFTGWGEACTGTSDCIVTMDTAKSVTATFTLEQYDLSVALDGTGNGTVTSTPPGIDCDTACTAAFNYGTVVTLTAAADLNSVFAGWTGACVGSADCVVTIGVAQAVTATFALEQHPLSAALDGNGSGTVTSNPPGIDCGSGGADCMENFDYGTVVTLTATTDTGSTFAGWSGACAGSGDCTVTMDAAKNVTATFTLEQYDLSVALDSTGSGTVTSNLPGIDCGAACTATFDYGTVVTLTATADLGSTFAGWSGACTGNDDDCVITIAETTIVTANFTEQESGFALFLPLVVR
ncbi:MAG: hypothetical protein GY792_13245, partial [Gammaproteobacteria bacterium]|nr:hypothetical protein [Gammaproteobacteria bacterium]